MSVVRQVDPATTTPCVGKSSGTSSNLPNQVFRIENQMFRHGPASYCLDVNNQQSSVQQLELGSQYQQQVSAAPYQLTCNSGSSICSENLHASCFSNLEQPHASFLSISNQNSGSMSDELSPENEKSYGGDEIRSKLQQLEKELLNDTDDEILNESDDMGIDDDWVTPMKNLLLPSSTKESSSDSNVSSADSIKEPKTPKQLLFECAASISEGNYEEAAVIISNLRQTVSIQGDPPQRLAAYLVEGLAARMASSGRGIYKALKCKEPPTSDRLSAMQILFEVCPCFKFGFMAANGAIVEAFKGEEKVHIIDFDINQGSQYITLMQALSTRAKKTHLRITGVDDPESVQRLVGGLRIIGLRLEKLAEELHIPFEFRAIGSKTADVTPSMLGCRTGEALVVNFAYQLHHMPDESVSTVNQRDQLLRMVKGLRPKLVTVVEQDVNTNTAPFFPRFVEVYNYYHAVFESLDATLPRDSPDRMNVERQCLARDIVNIVACEGADRIERYEVAGKWRARMTMAGFVSCPLSSYVNGEIKAQLNLYCNRYKVKEESGALYFGWEDKILVVASVWK